MLQGLRNASQGWAFRIFLGLLIVCFVVLWGVSDIFQFGGTSNGVVATVGSKKISTRQFAEALRRELITLKTRDDLDSIKAQLKGVVLGKLLREALFDLEADNLGLVVTDEQVKQEIRQIKGLQDEDGSFDKQRFNIMLRTMEMSEQQYVDLLRGELRRQQLISALFTGISVPTAMVKPLAAWRHETFLVDFTVISPDNIKTIPTPSDQETKAYYEKHPTKFTEPESRDLTVLHFNAQMLLAKVQLTDEEITKGFEDQQSEFAVSIPTEAEKALVLQTLKKEKVATKLFELSTQIEDNLAGGAKLAEIAKKFDLALMKLSNVKQDGTFTSKSPTDFNQNLISAVVKEGFANSADAEISLIEAQDSNYIGVQVEQIRPAALKPFQDVQSQVIKAWQQEKRLELTQQLAEKIVQQINQGASFAQLANANNLQLKPKVKLSRSSTEYAAEIPDELRKQLFEAKAQTAVFAPSPSGYSIAYLQKIIPVEASETELNELKNRINSMLADDIGNQLLVTLEKKYKIEINERMLKQI